MSTSTLHTDQEESFSSKKWIAAFLLAIALAAVALFYQYDRGHTIESPSRPVSLEGKLVPLSSEQMITHVGQEKILYYRIISPIEPYNEVYIFSEPGKGEGDDMVMYAKEKISCTGMVKIMGREADMELNLMVSDSREGGTRGETQVLIDKWECVK